MGEVIFEVFFETFSKHLHLFGMGMGILQPQTKNFSSLVHKKMYSIKNYPLTLNTKKSCKIYTLSRKIFIKIFAPSPIPNGKRWIQIKKHQPKISWCRIKKTYPFFSI